MIVPTQITNTEVFAFIIVLVFKLSSRKVFLINRKDNRSFKKSAIIYQCFPICIAVPLNTYHRSE